MNLPKCLFVYGGGKAHLCFARVAVGFEGHEQAIRGHGVGLGHGGAFAPGQGPAGRISWPSEADAVWEGKGGGAGWRERHVALWRARCKALGFGADAAQGRPMGTRVTAPLQRAKAQVHINRDIAHRVSVRQQGCKRRSGGAAFGQHMRQARMQRHACQKPTMGGNAAA